MELIIMNFSNIYKCEDFYNNKVHKFIDLSDIEGTNCYCDDEAAQCIADAISTETVKAIHFIDSGNYHYVSKIWTDKIESPFNLLVFDHHTDMQEPQFGDILSCGGWIKKTIEENTNLNKVYIIGVREDLAKEIPEDLLSKVCCIDENHLTTPQFDTSLPYYLSIDKDALSPEFAVTNWDQGEISIDYIEGIIASIASKTQVIGIDICGEPNIDDTTSVANATNNQTNKRLIDFLNQL